MFPSLSWVAPVLVVLFMAIAGCLNDGRPENADKEAHDAPVGFLPPVALPQNAHHGAEPSIAVLDDGTLFVTAMGSQPWTPGAAEGKAWLWRSRDDGATWERLRGPYPDALGDERVPPGPTAVFCSCDPDVVTSPDGWVYYTDWWTIGNAVGNYVVERSADGGDTWMASPVTVPAAGGAYDPFWVDRQWLLAGDDGFVALFYHQQDTVEPSVTGPGHSFKVVTSHDHGATWSLPVTVQGGDRVNLGVHPRMLPDGSLLAPMLAAEGGGDDVPLTERPMTVRAAISSDLGATWDAVDIVDLPYGIGAGWPMAAAIGDDGHVLFAYNAVTPDGIHVFTVESEDGGRTWSEPSGLATQGLNALPWAAAHGDGRFAVAWYTANWTGDERDAPDDTEWFPMVAERTGIDGEWVFQRVDEEPVHVGPMCFDGGCSNSERPLRDYLGVEYGLDGSLHVVYTRSYVHNILDQDQFYPVYGKVQYAKRPAVMD